MTAVVDVAVEPGGEVYIVGSTGSSGFPVTPSAFDTSHNGGSDAFVVKLNAAGAALIYATFLGGSGTDSGYGVALDASDAAYVTGDTGSSNFPTTFGAFDRVYNGGAYDAYIVKLNAAGAALIYATFLGGNNGDAGSSIAVDTSGAVYVTGYTESSDFSTTPGAFDTTFNLGIDVSVAKLNSTGTALTYATFLGGSDYDYGLGIAEDEDGAAYVTGRTGPRLSHHTKRI